MYSTSMNYNSLRVLMQSFITNFFVKILPSRLYPFSIRFYVYFEIRRTGLQEIFHMFST